MPLPCTFPMQTSRITEWRRQSSREATSDPAKVWTAFLGAALLGLLVAGLVAVVDFALARYRPAGAHR